jgi:hypothetical protein
MKPLSDDELRMNQQASSVAASVLSEAVEAATRCEQVTTDMKAEAAGIGAVNRGLMRGMMSLNKASSVGRMGDGLRTGGLPKSFVLAVTASQVHALEDKHDGGNLVAGKVLKSWEREGFQARRGNAVTNPGLGVPDDRQVLTLLLPIEGGNNRYLKAAARNTAQTPGMPHRFMVAKDAASQAVIDSLVSASTGANVMIGGTSLQDMMARAGGVAPAAADPMERLGKVADLHQRGVLTDEEFATQKAKILSAS